MTLFSPLRSTQAEPPTDRYQWLAFRQIPLVEDSPSKAPKRLALLQPMRQWLLGIEITDRQQALRLCALIPAQCPFERTFKLFGRTLLSVPPLCKLNPFYDELVALRFRALCYLVEVCGDDGAPFCSPLLPKE